jgi:DNA-binding NarL/FixJ family response regulator
MKVLIVDDSAVIRERLIDLLSEIKGIGLIEIARDTTEARQVIDVMRPDAVVLDIRMPGGSGVDLLKEIKKETPGTFVIMLTSYPLSQYRKRCFESGADVFLDKSIQFTKIKGIFKGLIDRKKTEGSLPYATSAMGSLKMPPGG